MVLWRPTRPSRTNTPKRYPFHYRGLECKSRKSRNTWLLLLLSHFSCVRLCATPQTAAHQTPLSLGFSRQEHWSGLPFPSPMHESESESEVAQSCLTLSDPMDCSLSGSSIHGIFQARVLEWVAIAFSDTLVLATHKQRDYHSYAPQRARGLSSTSGSPAWGGPALGR